MSVSLFETALGPSGGETEKLLVDVLNQIFWNGDLCLEENLQCFFHCRLLVSGWHLFENK